MKVEFKRQFEFLQHTGSPQVFPCGVDANAPEELLNDAAFLFQQEHGMVVVIAEPIFAPAVGLAIAVEAPAPVVIEAEVEAPAPVEFKKSKKDK